MKKIFVCIVFLLVIKLLFSQTVENNKTDTINKNFIDLLQFVNPEFVYSSDTEFFTSSIYKNYIYKKAIAQEAKAVGFDTTLFVQNQIEQLKILVEEAYLAYLFEKEFYKDVYSVSDDDIKKYYNDNIDKYTEEPIFTYYWAYLNDTSKTTVSKVKRLLENEYKQYLTTNQPSKIADNNFKLSIEYQNKVDKNTEFYSRINSAKKGEVIGPFTYMNSPFMFILVEKKEPHIYPFEKVYDNCKSSLINARKAEKDKQFYEEAMKRYPFIIKLE